MTASRLTTEAHELQRIVEHRTGMELPISEGKAQGKAAIYLALSDDIEGEEGYCLEINAKRLPLPEKTQPECIMESKH